MLPENSDRRKRQKKLPIKVIIGNPPYSVGQGDANANNQNVVYPGLHARIAETYAKRSTATLKNALYDSYIRAIRWGSDRLKETGGVLAFVTNGGWIDANTADGMRKCLAEEFTRIDVFHLRGNARTQGEQRRKEGGNAFDQGSRAPVAITVLTLKKDHAGPARIRFHDIGDYLTREQKLAKIAAFGGLAGVSVKSSWNVVNPNEYGEWIGQRDKGFEKFMSLGCKDASESETIFNLYSGGVSTSRDAWCYNSSEESLASNIRRMISNYNQERQRFLEEKTRLNALATHQQRSAGERSALVDSFVTKDTTRISWSRALKQEVGKGTQIDFEPKRIQRAIYRPYSPSWLYFDRKLNEMVLQVPRLFPPGASNQAIALPGPGEDRPFSVLMLARLPDLHIIHGGQLFPRFAFEKEAGDGGLFGEIDVEPTRRDAITDAGLKHFTDAYPGEAISKDDLFYYVYGVLHSPDYRARYADNLRRQLPRIPLMKRAVDFWAFVEAGRKLGDLHVNYETVTPYPVTLAQGDLAFTRIDDPVAFWRVEKMKHPRVNGKEDLSTVIYNPRLTITNIPLDAYAYVVNGKPALKWVMERQAVTTDAASGIVNDANAYANETVGDPRYPFDLFCRIINVSLETMKIVNALPALDIRESGHK